MNERGSVTSNQGTTSHEVDLGLVDQKYLEQVRAEAARLGIRGRGPDLVREAIRDVEALASVDIDPPTQASQPGGRFVKDVIKRSVQWYIRYLAVQVNAFGQAMVSFGNAVVNRIDEVEGSMGDLERKLDALDGRVRHLEAGQQAGLPK